MYCKKTGVFTSSSQHRVTDWCVSAIRAWSPRTLGPFCTIIDQPTTVDENKVVSSSSLLYSNLIANNTLRKLMLNYLVCHHYATLGAWQQETLPDLFSPASKQLSMQWGAWALLPTGQAQAPVFYSKKCFRRNCNLSFVGQRLHHPKSRSNDLDSEALSIIVSIRFFMESFCANRCISNFQ